MSMQTVYEEPGIGTAAASGETERLQEAVDCLRTAIADCLMEIDTIQLQVNPRIESDYAVAIGCLENDLLKCQIAARRAKRKLELAQAEANRGSQVEDADLEQQLEGEFAAWQRMLDERVRQYLDTVEERAASRFLAPYEADELKRLHRSLIKRMHPDVHPELGEQGRRYFAIVQAAFEKGDVELLRSVDAATAHLALPAADEVPTPDELAAELALLEAQLSVLEDKLEVLKTSMPYTLRAKLDDPTWVQATTESLKAQIDEQVAARESYERRLAELQGGM